MLKPGGWLRDLTWLSLGFPGGVKPSAAGGGGRSTDTPLPAEGKEGLSRHPERAWPENLGTFVGKLFVWQQILQVLPDMSGGS